MKKFISLIFILSFSLSLIAKDLKNDVVLVSYEQSWSDYEGTIALKNNTNEVIRNVSFIITYLDMQGNEMDYQDISRSVTIAPGMTRKLNIPAYEHRRNYHYYKTKDEYGHPAFKINYQLKDYNYEDPIVDDINNLSNILANPYSSSEDSLGFWEVFLVIFLVLTFIGAIIGLYVLVAVMAKKRHRNVAAWVFLSILGTPLLMVIILLVVGDETPRIEQD